MSDVILDGTMLSLLMSCPRRYDFRGALWVPAEGKSNSLECGSLAHFILEHYNKGLIEGKSRVDAINQGFTAGMEYVNGYAPDNKFLKDESEIGLVATPENSYKEGNRDIIGWRYVFKTMEEYFDYWRNDTNTPIGAECVKGTILYKDDDIRVLWKAKFDEIDDTNAGFISLDHKSMKQRRDTMTLSNQFMGQCMVLKSRSVI